MAASGVASFGSDLSTIHLPFIISSLRNHQKMSTVNVAVIGVGLVGKEFLNQLVTVASNSTNKSIRLVYVSNSRNSVYVSEGILLDKWEQELAQNQSTKVDPLDLPNRLHDDLGVSDPSVPSHATAVVVDNTSSDAIAALYPVFLHKGIHVITPNKKAYSSNLTLYNDILARSGGVGGGRYLNESTVGAGLPIISTLKDLVATGDEVSHSCIQSTRDH